MTTTVSEWQAESDETYLFDFPAALKKYYSATSLSLQVFFQVTSLMLKDLIREKNTNKYSLRIYSRHTEIYIRFYENKYN